MIASARDAAPVAILDVSANRTTLELGHPDARAILAGGLLDRPSPARLCPGRCAQTPVARAGVILWQLDDRPTYRLLVSPLFAAYIAQGLSDAIGESR